MLTLKITSFKNFFFGVFIIIIFTISCKQRQTDNNNSQSSQNITDSNQVLNERTVKYFDLSNLKIKKNKESVTNVSKEQALSIADDIFNKEHGRKSLGNVTVCDNGLGWWVIYGETGDEYSISKNNISNNYENIEKWKKRFPLSAADETVSKNITEKQAFEIAVNQYKLLLERINSLGTNAPISDSTKKAIQKEISSVIPAACELKNSWRIYYLPRSVLNGEYPNDNPPNYLIDKRTGNILYTSKGQEEINKPGS